LNKRLILLLPLVLVVSLFPSQMILNAHASGYTGTGLVCITSPATATNCSNSAPTIGPVTVGSTFTVGVFINNSQPMGGFDIYVAVNASYLNPTNATLGPLITSPSLTNICVNGLAQTGTCTTGTANGPGVVEASTVESSGTNECSNAPPCSGLAFNVTYKVVGPTASTPIFYPADGAGCSPSSVATPTDVCVLVADALGNTLPENVLGARVTQGVTVNPTSTAVSCISPVTVGKPTTCTATVTDTATTGATNPTGQVTLSTSGSGGFNPSTCTLSSVGTNQAACLTSYTPTSVGTGTHNIGASYPGDTVHTGSATNSFSLTVSPASPTVGTTVILETTGGLVTTNVPVGSSVHETAVLMGGYPTTGVSGTVTYTLYANGNCGTPGTVGSRVTVAASNNAPDSASFILSSPGNYSFQAVYTGDSSNAPGTSSCQLVIVGATTTSTVTCSPSPAVMGTSTSCTVTVKDTSPSPRTPSGIVSFITNSTGTFTNTNSCTLAAGTTTGIASCTITYTPVATGHHFITASYGGDSTHATSVNTSNMPVAVLTTSAPPSTILGLSPAIFYSVIGAIVVVAALLAFLVLRRRGKTLQKSAAVSTTS